MTPGSVIVATVGSGSTTNPTRLVTEQSFVDGSGFDLGEDCVVDGARDIGLRKSPRLNGPIDEDGPLLLRRDRAAVRTDASETARRVSDRFAEVRGEQREQDEEEEERHWRAGPTRSARGAPG